MNLTEQMYYINSNSWYYSEINYKPIKISFDKLKYYRLKLNAWNMYQATIKE